MINETYITENQTRNPLVIIAGPTAVGKSALAVKLAKRIGGEIISADSMQVYKGMNIGSAKITPEEMDGVSHYLIDELEPWDEFHVVEFQHLAKKYMQQIWEKGKIPILAGGTGFYIQAVLRDIDFSENEGDHSYRNELEAIAGTQGSQVLYDMLYAVDPKGAEAIHPNNAKRLIRALEFYRETGKKISEHNEQEAAKESPYAFAYFVLNDKRDIVYQKIEQRVDQMIQMGLLDEVKNLKNMGCTRQMVSMQGLGYKEILDYLEGDCTLEDAIYRIKRDTRHFAKRQITWFKREQEVIWINKDEFCYQEDRILDYMEMKLKEQGVIA